LERAQGVEVIVKRVLVAAQHSENRTNLLDELRRLGCDIVGPFASTSEALDQLRRGPVQMGVIGFRLLDGSSHEIERRLRSAGTPIVYQVSPGHDKMPVRLRDGRLIAVAHDFPVADLLQVVECDPDFVAGR
jgi:CheY-like chemotaxis protein